MTERTFDDRLRDTYFEAQKAAATSCRVEIHVGQKVWDRLHAMAAEAGVEPGLTPALFGFEVWLERGWGPDRIEVQTTRLIH